VQVLNRGVSGDRTTELLARWKDDCLGLKPTWLSIKIGVNDVWRKRDEWGGQGHIPLTEYVANYRKLLDQARAGGIKNLVLVSPTTIDDEPETELNLLLGEYDAAVVELANEYGAIYVPAREAMWKAIAKNPEVRWTTDGCHPTIAGHGLIANAWLDAVLR
jgi:acyl-CoA thioesterase-1